jgi:transposase-like protein
MSQERRRRWSVEEKAALVRETYEPGMNVSLVARNTALARASCLTGASWNEKVPRRR